MLPAGPPSSAFHQALCHTLPAPIRPEKTMLISKVCVFSSYERSPGESDGKTMTPRSDTKTAASRRERFSQAAHSWRKEDVQVVAQRGVSTEPTKLNVTCKANASQNQTHAPIIFSLLSKVRSLCCHSQESI